MYKTKTSYYYLERGFPENLEPAFTNQSTKHKRFLVERKKRVLKRAICKSLRTLVKPFFSAPTKKGILLEKSGNSFQDVSSQQKGKDLLKKPTGDVLDPVKNTCKNVVQKSIFAKQHKEIKNRLPGETSFVSQPNPLIGRKTSTRTILNPVKKNVDFLLQNKENLHLQKKCRRYKFLFPLHRLKGELSKRESQYGKIELYKKQIQEKKKLAFIYGTMSKNSVKRLVKQARNLSSAENPPTRGLVTLLESRLDVALFRASFFSSIPMARQWINHNKVAVNKNKVRAPNYQLKGGDCIEILSTCAPSLKEKIRQRIAKILPFRRSRRKLVTPSLIENWCSLERLLPREKGNLHATANPLGFTFAEQMCPKASGRAFVFSKEKTQPCVAKKHFCTSHKKQSTADTKSLALVEKEKVLVSPPIIENFSLIKDHLQSMWEKSEVFFSKEKRPPRSFSHSMNRVENVNLTGRAKSDPLTLSQPARFPAKRKEKTDGRDIFDKKSRKIRTSSSKIHFVLQKGVTLFGRLRKKEVKTLDFLNAKKALIQPRNRMQKIAALQISAIKPLHLEISYKLLTAIFLYSPQKVAYPGNLDLPLIMRSFK